MLYAIMATEDPRSLERRLEARPSHLARLQELVENGRLVIAGPHPAIDSEDPGPEGFSGSLIIAEFDSLEEAKDWAADDPFVHASVYQQIVVKPFKHVLPR